MDYWILLIAYVLALLANAAASIFWGVNYKRATDRLLEAKDAQMATLRELTSAKVFEHFQSTKALLEDSIRDKEDQIRALLEDRQSSKDELRDQLVEMRAIWRWSSEFLKRLSKGTCAYWPRQGELMRWSFHSTSENSKPYFSMRACRSLILKS